MRKKMIGKSLLFTALLAVLLAALSPIFVYKTEHRAKLEEGLYLSDDQYDVIFMGSSHMNGGLDPNVIWNQQGIPSFNYATGGQSLDVTYYLLKEVLKTHKSPLVVVDLFYLGMTTQYGESGLISNTVDNMQFSGNKLETIWNCVSPQDRIAYLLPVLKYHFRWSSLQEKDFGFDVASLYYSKGFAAGTNRYGKPNSEWKATDNRIDIPEKSLEYLNKIIDLSKTENFDLIFINMPCDYSEAEKESDWVNDCEALFNTVADVAEENGIPFLDLYDKKDEVGLDFANDMNNAGHLNLWGAYKISSYFGNYLAENYDLEDHRSDSAYAQWNEDYKYSQAASVT
ncbi:MAG: hypothetical protein ACQGTM_06585 [bacterium]